MGSEMPESGWLKNVNGASRLSNFWNFFGEFQMISCRDCWPWTKPGYITMTRRQNNNQWSDGIAAHVAPKYSVCKNPLEKFSPRFFGIKTAFSSLIFFQRVKISTWIITHLCWCTWRTFWRKNAAGRSPRRFCFCTTMLRLTGHLQPRRNWTTWASSVLITNIFSGSGPVGLPPVPGLKKTIERSSFFVRRGGHCCREDLVGRRNFWLSLEWLAKLEQRAKMCIELRGEYVE